MEFDKYRDAVETIQENARTAVIWGAGSNRPQRGEPRPVFEHDYSGFALVGCRDYGYEHLGFDWVPCPSCMHPAFDETYEVTREVAYFGNVVRNGSVEELTINDMASEDKMGNAKRSIEEVVAFLGSAELVVSSSYHGCYWATLLGKKVIAVGRNGSSPRSSKFYGFKHVVPHAKSRDWKTGLPQVTAYPHALEECRDANRAFARKVKQAFDD